jgi:predicted ester cyclase
MASNRELITHAVECWNAGDLDGYLRLYDANIRLHGYSPEPMDKAAVTEFYSSVFAGLTEPGKPAPRLELLDIVEDGDKIATRFVLTGRHSGAFMNVPASGNDFVLPGMTILQFANGAVIERWSNADMLGLMAQMGAIPLAA